MTKQRLAYTIVQKSIRNGELPNPATMRCFDCDGKAREYHHYLGYDFPLVVLPLCHSCHFKREPRYTNRKLNREQVLSIRASSEKQEVLAARYGVDQSAISFVQSRKTYREII
jgi:hypothetical protein